MRKPSGSGAIAVFVKTPTLSPVKTRLGQDFGRENAEEFHLLASHAMEEIARRACDENPDASFQLSPFWAVSEKAALSHPLWSGMPTVWQGEGALGDRLDRVYGELLQRHEFVLLLGADTPQLTPELLLLASARCRKRGFVLGPSADGGFYLFGCTHPVASEVWRAVNYSSATTAAELVQRLARLGPPDELPCLRDVDTLEDLKALESTLSELEDPSPAQKALENWIRSHALS